MVARYGKRSAAMTPWASVRSAAGSMGLGSGFDMGSSNSGKSKVEQAKIKSRRTSALFRLSTVSGRAQFRLRRVRTRRQIPRRQRDRKCGPNPQRTAHVQSSAVAFDDVVRNKKSQAGAFAGFFGREERLEELRLQFFGDSVALIGHAHANALLYIAHFHAYDSAAWGHGMLSVDDQINQHLLKLPFVAFDRRNVWFEIQHDFDALLRQILLEQRDHGVDDALHFDFVAAQRAVGAETGETLHH